MAMFSSALGFIFISHIDSVSYLKAKALRHKVTSSYGEKAQHTTDSGLSVLKSLPWGFHSASDCERIPFRVHHPSYSVNFVALRSCQGMSMGVPDPEDIGPGSTPSCS